MKSDFTNIDNNIYNDSKEQHLFAVGINLRCKEIILTQATKPVFRQVIDH
jgi:hypothetical protein